MRAAAHQALEREVAARTQDLRAANAELQAASELQAETDRRYRASREELAQASRLGSLGQITAGVAHEINQPLAAIRSFAVNGIAYMTLGDGAKEVAILGTTIELTASVSPTTDHLRHFSPRPPTPLTHLPLPAAVHC